MNNSGDYLLGTLDESDRFAGSMASCIGIRFPLYNYRPVTMDKGMTNTVSGMLRFEVADEILIERIHVGDMICYSFSKPSLWIQ